MNADLTHEDWNSAMAEATGEAAPVLTAETRQEAALLTGNFAGTVEAIIADMDVQEKFDKASEALDSAHALMQSEETRARASDVFTIANHAVHELEKMALTEAEKSKLSALNKRLIEIALEFAVPAHKMEEVADMECPK